MFLIAYGAYQDAHFEVPYTDIDYRVYSDAARFVCDGESPYARSTYRYTPLLAWLLTPTCVFPDFGKVVFAACDVLAVWMMMREREVSGDGNAHTSHWRMLVLWLFSPFTVTISTRGSGESLVVCMLVGVLWLLESGRVVVGAVVYGLAVHWRIFPIVYAPSILLYLSMGSRKTENGVERDGDGTRGGEDTARTTVWSLVSSYVSIRGVVFGVVSAGVFFALGAVMHGLYGKEFLDEAYLYHLTRVDPRHNFSFYFYPAYLFQATGGGASRDGGGYGDIVSMVFSLTGGAVQVAIADRMMRRAPRGRGGKGGKGKRGGREGDAGADLAMTFFAQTIAFVAFNKVSTAQYFVWYLCWFCLRLERALELLDQRLIVAWVVAMGNWLFWAYLLEFRGMPVHLFIWASGILWFFVNIVGVRMLMRDGAAA